MWRPARAHLAQSAPNILKYRSLPYVHAAVRAGHMQICNMVDLVHMRQEGFIWIATPIVLWPVHS